MKRCRLPAAAVAALLAALAGAAPAQPRAWPLAADAEPLRIDGRLDDAAWRDAPVHDAFVQFLPVDRQPAPPGYRTTLQIVVEEHALVFGIRAFDPRPQEIRAPLTRRDRVGRDQDFVTVYIDPAGDRRAAQFVQVSAAGVLGDGVHVAATDSEDLAPDFDVEAAVARQPDGYSVELRVPFIALRYPYEGGAPWRVMASRSIPRESSTLLLSAPLDKEALHLLAELQPVAGLEDLTARVRGHALLQARPELTLRRTRDAAGRREHENSLGMELKWRPRADWVFDATLNPDFSQVELDVPQLAGNTRFALSVPEKRPFFLESTDVVDLPISAFYSRSVADPGWGLRGTWRGVGGDAVALSLRDDGGGLRLSPGAYGTGVRVQDGPSQATLLRGRRHLGTFTVGALLSVRDDEAGSHNEVAGADLAWRADERQWLQLRALGSRTSAPATPGLDGHHLHAAWRLRVPGWNLRVDLRDISPGFRNDNGFVDQAGVRWAESELIRRFGEVALPGFTAHEFEAYVWAQHKATQDDPLRGVRGGETVSRRVHPGLWLIAARNAEAWAQLLLDAERARPGGRLHETPGVAAMLGINPAPWFTRLTAEVRLGRLLDVDADRTGRGAEWMLDARLRAPLPGGWALESEQRVEQTLVAAPDGRRALTETAAQWLGVLHFSARDALRVVWQAAHFTRRADVSAALAAESFRGRTVSLVFQRQTGLGRSLSVGAIRQRNAPADARAATELFAKASFVL